MRREFLLADNTFSIYKPNKALVSLVCLYTNLTTFKGSRKGCADFVAGAKLL